MATVGGFNRRLPTIVNLAAWYRYRIGVTSISGVCSQWADQSGAMRHLVQATADSRPAVNSDGSLTFDGTDDYLQATFTLVQPCTIYLAYRQLASTSGDIIFDGATANCRLAQSTANAITISAGSSLSDSTTIGIGANGITACVFDSTDSVMQNAGGAASSTTTGDASTNDPGGITLGAARTPANYANIRVYEMAVYSEAHDATTRLAIMRYLGRIASVGGIT